MSDFSNCRAVFIDIDDTILDFDAYVRHALEKGFEKFGLPPFTDKYMEIFTRENDLVWQELEEGKIDYAQLMDRRFNRVFRAMELECDGHAFEKYFRSGIYNFALPVDGAYDLLKYLSSKYTVCAASNGPYNQQLHRLELADMKKYFTHLFISEDIGWAKPARQFYDKAMEILDSGIENDEIVAIGDSVTSDMTGAWNSGMKTILFNKYGKYTERDFEGKRRPDAIAPSLESIKEIL